MLQKVKGKDRGAQTALESSILNARHSRIHFLGSLSKTKEKFQGTKWPPWADTILFRKAESCATNQRPFPPSQHSVPHWDYAAAATPVFTVHRRRIKKAAAQNSLIRSAMIHGVITGQAGSRLQNWAQLTGGFHSSR